MGRETPSAGCHDVDLGVTRRLPDAAAVAIEDYARVLLRAERAEAIVMAGAGRETVVVHVCGVATPPAEELCQDLAAFARDLAGEREGGGLGWS